MTRILFCLLALILAVPPASAQVRDGDFGPFVLEWYIEGQGGAMFRGSTLTIPPAAPDDTPRWNGELERVVVVTESGQWHVIDSFLSSGHSSGVRAEAMLPPPESVILILFNTSRDPWRGWLRKDADGYANKEVSYFDQSGRRRRTPPCEPRECFANLIDDGLAAQIEGRTTRFMLGGELP